MSVFLVPSRGSVDLWVRQEIFLFGIFMLTFDLVQLLHKLSIRGVNGPEKLLKVIKVGRFFFRFTQLSTAN